MGVNIAVYLGLVVVLALVAFGFLVVHLARRAQMALSAERDARDTADALARQTRMDAAQITTAPDDAALDSSLHDGTF